VPALSRARALARIAAALVIGLSAATIAAACGEGNQDAATPAEDGMEDGAVIVAACPKTQPPAGSECRLPEGTTCDFGLCGTRLAQCSRGVWVAASNGPPRPPCPVVPPNEGIACPPCWSPEVSCTYGSTDCSLPDASDNRTIAACPEGAWVVEFRPCRDAGPDVQRDGRPDAD
jgi:hypothetical protein